MKVKPESAGVCNGCGSKDSFIYFGGPVGLRRVCMVCENEQTGIDMHSIGYSDDPPESEMEICDECGYRGTKPCTFCAIVDSHQSDVFVAKQVSDYPPAPAPECECSKCDALRRDAIDKMYDFESDLEDYKVELEFADGRNLIGDGILEQQELEDYENIEHEYFDLSGDSVPS